MNFPEYPSASGGGICRRTPHPKTRSRERGDCKGVSSFAVHLIRRVGIPNFFILEKRVVGFRPSNSAAPSGPFTRHDVRSSTPRMCCATASSSFSASGPASGSPPRQVRHLQRPPPAHDHGPLDQVAQLPHVPRPGVVHQGVQGRFGIVSMASPSSARTGRRRPGPAAGCPPAAPAAAARDREDVQPVERSCRNLPSRHVRAGPGWSRR